MGEMLPKDNIMVMERCSNTKHSPSLAKLVCLLECQNVYLSTGLDLFAAHQGTSEVDWKLSEVN